MRGVTDDGAGTEKLTRGRRRKVVLADVDARCARHQREVSSVVDDDVVPYTGRARRDRRVAEIEEGTGRKLLGAELNESGTAVEKRACEIDRRPTGPVGRLDISYRVQRYR